MNPKLSPLPVQHLAADSEEAALFFPPLNGDKMPTAPTSTSAAPPAGAPPPPPPSETELRIMQLEQMLQEAKSHAEQQENEAYTSAYTNGEKAGIALGKSRADDILDQLEKMLTQADQQMQHIQQASADAIIDIAQMVTETLIGELSNDQRDWLFKAAARVSEAMNTGEGRLKLALHPDDLADLKTVIGEQAQPWQLVADSNLTSGSCRLMSDQQDALIDPIHSVAELVRQVRPELQASIHPPNA
ncbi:MAG: FliH/SctL family protein [Mariprofundales bacterium]